jgi:hypothetical protein
VLYDFDDAEFRVHFVFHRHADLRDLDPASAEWQVGSTETRACLHSWYRCTVILTA